MRRMAGGATRDASNPTVDERRAGRASERGNRDCLHSRADEARRVQYNPRRSSMRASSRVSPLQNSARVKTFGLASACRLCRDTPSQPRPPCGARGGGARARTRLPERIPAAPSARTRRRRASRAVARVQRESGMRTPPRGVRARGFSSSGRCFRSSPSRRTASAVASSLRRRLRSASGPSARRNQRASVSGETSGRRIADRAPTSALSSHDPRRSDAPESVARRRRSRREP